MLEREGTTSARLRQIRETIPPSHKITKTELAKYLNAWDRKPDTVSLGAQKNFERFMDSLKVEEGQPALPLPDVAAWKAMIAKATLFKKTHALVRPMFPAFQANVVAYVVSLLSERLGDRIKLEMIWEKQDVSSVLCQQLQAWAREVNKVLHDTASGRMISEWAKKPECWERVRSASYSSPIDNIPEIR